MYPKQPPTRSQLNDSMDFKKQIKREQLAQLLINKFRNKYNINSATEKDLDTLIQDEVKQLILHEANVSEN